MGRYSSEGLAAVSAAISIFSIFSVMVSSSITGFQILAPKYYAARSFKMVKLIFCSNLLLSTCFSIFCMIIIYLFRFPMLSLITTSQSLKSVASEYLLARLPELLLLFPTTMLIVTFSSEKKTKWGFYTVLVSGGTKVILSLPLIYGFWFFPELGAFGAGISSTCGFISGLIFMVMVFLTKSPHKDLFLNNIKVNKKVIQRLIKISAPTSFSLTMDYFSNFLIFSFIGLLGTTFLAGGRIGFQVTMFLFSVFTSLCSGSRILIGRAWGEKNVSHIKDYSAASFVLAIVLSVPIMLCFLFYPKLIINIFTSQNDVHDVTTRSFQIIGLLVPLVSLSTCTTSVLKALGETKKEMFSNIASVWLVQLPLTYILIKFFNYKLEALFLGLLFYFLTKAILSYFFYFKALKNMNQIFEKAEK